jgi:alpha-beta hydrolase superfamily lysophospholipase
VKIALATIAVALLAASAHAAHGQPAAAATVPSRVAAPRPLQLKQRCVSRAERRRVVRFTAADRVRLIGVEFGRGPNAVVLAHQGGGAAGPTLCSWVPYARQLARAGYRVLAFDHRGYGSSSKPSRPTLLFRIDEDVVAAVRTMRRRGATRIVVGGASLGGAAVVSAAARIQPLVQGVFTLGSPQAFGSVDAVAAARTLQVPALFTSAVDDDPFNDDARALFDACASVDKRLELFPGSRHGSPTLRDPQAKALVDAWVAAHLRQ